MAKKKIEELIYKERPLTRRGNEMFYGFIDDKFLVKLTVKESQSIDNLEVGTKIMVQLITNNTYLQGKERVIKQKEATGLYSALDLGFVWLDDALSFEA
ncbi:MAG: hypothetical protein IJE46_06205 [Clostridia bacterium]|nr:hypothetical protein [Clostridia bacterium]